MKAFYVSKSADGKALNIHPDKLVYGVEAIRANLECRLSIVQGEYMPNVLLGIPLGATKDETDLYVQRIILETEGITGISSFTSSVVNKVYSCKFHANTVYGGLTYE